MRRSNLAIAFVLLAVLSGAKAHAQQVEERVQLKDGRISFVLPAGFKPMSKEDINVKFGRIGAAYAPEFAYSNERQNVSVAVGFGGSGLQAAQLDELKKFLEAQFERRVRGVEWIEREIINDMYATVFDGQMLFFNFNSTVAQYENYNESLRRSAQTITVK